MASDFDFKVITESDAAARRRELRTSTGGRKSKYSPVGDQLMNLKEGQVLSFNLAPNQIISLRNYVTRNFPEKYKVTTRRVSDEQFEAHISAAEGTPPKRRGRAKKAAA